MRHARLVNSGAFACANVRVVLSSHLTPRARRLLLARRTVRTSSLQPGACARWQLCAWRRRLGTCAFVWRTTKSRALAWCCLGCYPCISVRGLSCFAESRACKLTDASQLCVPCPRPRWRRSGCGVPRNARSSPRCSGRLDLRRQRCLRTLFRHRCLRWWELSRTRRRTCCPQIPSTGR